MKLSHLFVALALCLQAPVYAGSSGGSSGGLPGAGEVTEAMLKAVDAANDEECLTFEVTTGDFEWQACGGAGALADGDYGDVAVSGSGTVMTVEDVTCTDCIGATEISDLALGTDTSGNYVSDATANQGLLLTGTEGASLGLIDCEATEVLKRNAGDTAWECAADATGAGIGGSTGATDDRIIISDGTGGATIAASAAALTAAGSLTIPSAESIEISTDVGLTRAAAGILKVTDGSTGDGTVRTSIGTKALPALAFDDDVDTGIYQRATGFLMFTANGAEVGFVGGGATHGWVAPNGIGFSSNTESSGVDVGLTRHVTGILRVTAGSNNVAPILHALAVEANTAGSGSPNLLTANESLAVMTNEGSTAKNYHTLVTAAGGITNTFCVQDADGVRIVANTSDTIRVLDKVTAAAGYIESTTIGSCVTLLAINAVEWFATSVHGVWTDGTFTYDDTGNTSP